MVSRGRPLGRADAARPDRVFARVDLGCAVLILCLARRELTEKRPGWESSTETISLERLSGNRDRRPPRRASRGWPSFPRPHARRIVEVAEGNALFVEQLLAHATKDVGPEGLDEAVPPSIEALLAGRLDRLEAGGPCSLEQAAVVGKDFERSAVLHLSPPEIVATVDSRLDRLERKELIQVPALTPVAGR